METLLQYLRGLVDGFLVIGFFVFWVAGTLLAVGWFKLLAVCFPPFAVYLVGEALMRASGLVS